MKLGRRLPVVVALVSCALWAAPVEASAHPLGNFTINQYSGIEVATDEIVVHYVVDMAEIPTIQELGIRSEQVVDQDALDEYAQKLAPRILDNLTLTANGNPVSLDASQPNAELLPGEGPLEVLRLEVDFAGALEDPGATIEYTDGNYADRVGWKEIAIYPVGGQGLERSSVPSSSSSDELRRYPQDELSSPLSQTTATADLSLGNGGDPGTPQVREETASFDLFGGSFASLIERDLTPAAFLFMLLLAVGFGAVHALGPGHGKTVMAAYLVGTEGRVRHAVSVGIAVSIMHTFSVIALGLLTLWASSLFPPESVYPYLSLVSGVVVLALGGWLLRVRLSARAERREPLHHHAPERELVGVGARENEHDLSQHQDHGVHSHGHDHLDDSGGHTHGFGYHTHSPAELPAGASVLSRRGLVAIALSGGLLPSPSALVVLLGSIALGRVAFGLTLVAAFSVGLAGALTLVGIAVLRVRAYATRRFGSRAAMALPILSAAAITLLGAWLTLRALLTLT
ncbi:MAG: nickel/cobalt transporter [Actinomycetota bacterium]